MSKVMGRRVSADVIETDQYRRLVAVIRYAGRDVNREMVAEGMAWAFRHYLQGVYASEYIGAESRARSRREGLWRDRNPQPPWEFRQALKGSGRHGRSYW
jgi:endonuclease YncB( thermonuclease family)